MAQGLRAGAATVEERFHVHSLHAYFIRPGDADQPIRFDVTRSRDGRSFCTRSVVASQADVGVILTMSLSFQVDESGHDVQTVAMPPVPPPEELSGYSWSPMFQRRFAELRNEEEGRGVAWLQLRDTIGDDRRAAGLRPRLPVRRPAHRRGGRRPPRPTRPGRGRRLRAGLDVGQPRPRHLVPPPVARPTSGTSTTSPATATCPAAASSIGHVLSTDGLHVATIAQEVLLRKTPLTTVQSTRSPYIQRSGSAMSSSRSPSGPRK